MTSWNEGFRTFRRNLQVTGSEIILLSKSSNIFMNFKFNQNHLSASHCHSVSIEDRECLLLSSLGRLQDAREREGICTCVSFLSKFHILYSTCDLFNHVSWLQRLPLLYIYSISKCRYFLCISDFAVSYVDTPFGLFASVTSQLI